MQTYVIVTKSNYERYRHISKHLKKLKMDYVEVEGINKNDLNDEIINQYIIKNNIKEIMPWMSLGMIAVSTSHTLSYIEFLNSNDDIAFFIEDDVILPKNINKILDEIEKNISNNELILLDYRIIDSLKPDKIGISKVEAIKLTNGILAYPVKLEGLIGAAAYILTKNVALNIVNIKDKALCVSDNWYYFYQKGAFEKLRVFYPNCIKFKPFQSSVGTIEIKSIKDKTKNIIEKNKIPPFYQLLIYRRKYLYHKKKKQFYLTNEKSIFNV